MIHPDNAWQTTLIRYKANNMFRQWFIRSVDRLDHCFEVVGMAFDNIGRLLLLRKS